MDVLMGGVVGAAIALVVLAFLHYIDKLDEVRFPTHYHRCSICGKRYQCQGVSCLEKLVWDCTPCLMPKL